MAHEVLGALGEEIPGGVGHEACGAGELLLCLMVPLPEGALDVAQDVEACGQALFVDEPG